jgi:hypothetical protein
MHIEFFVEELSAEAALREIVPRIVGPEVSFQLHPFQGKPDLLKRLPDRLRAYRRWLPEDWRIVVLVDEDRQDCLRLKQQLEEMSKRAGFATKTKPRADSSFRVINRIAIEELEAWFFGDPGAILTAYPGVRLGFFAGRRFRDPDAIRGGTAEALEQVLQRSGYYSGGMSKIQVARDVARHMTPAQNRSRSFCHFRDALLGFSRG